MSDEKRVRVRIAVGVNSDGDWQAAGCDLWSDSQARKEAMHTSDHPTFHFVEAWLPVPPAQVAVEGEVQP
jgi:hypothetical protein